MGLRITKEELDILVEQDQFAEGAFIEPFGDGHGEPYNPYRQVYGQLKSGLVVFCELSAQGDCEKEEKGE